MRDDASPTYDVADSFTRSLYSARIARGEPPDGLRRKLWKASVGGAWRPMMAGRIALGWGAAVLGLGGILLAVGLRNEKQRAQDAGRSGIGTAA